MKIVRTLIALSLVAGLGLPACSKKTPEPETAPATAPAEGEATPPPAETPAPSETPPSDTAGSPQ